MQCFSSSVYHQSNRVIKFAYDLRDFEVDSSLDFLLSGSEHEELFVNAEVVLGPPWEKTLP